MYLFACVASVLVTFAFAAENGSSCITPNGESATCIPISACTAIKRAIAYFNPAAIEFARKSQCGYDEAGPLVCCGSTGRVTTVIPVGQTTEVVYLTNPQSYPENVDNQFLPDSTLCGIQITQNRKATSKEAQIDEYPWLAVLTYVKGDGRNGGFYCTGTLISDKYVLTAAQCLDIPGLTLKTVRLGEWKFSSDEDCVVPQGVDNICTVPENYEVQNAIRHHYYDKSNGDNNIALIRLKKRVQYTEFIRAICLPPSSHPSPARGQPLEASGWGVTEKGKVADTKLKLPRFMGDPKNCSQEFSIYKQININQACFTSQPNSRCAVDTGSPLMRLYEKSDALDEEQYYQEGIIYNNYNFEAKGQPCLYTRVAQYTDWITNHLEF